MLKLMNKVEARSIALRRNDQKKMQTASAIRQPSDGNSIKSTLVRNSPALDLRLSYVTSPSSGIRAGEYKAKVLKWPIMAKRPASVPNDAMTRQQLKELERNLSLLSPYIVKEKYRQAADRCRFLDLPTPRVIQELVTTWKVLWRWRK
jgi:hypothetical protein